MNKDCTWVGEEVGSEDFGDKRLKKRFEQTLFSLASSPQKSIPSSTKGWHETLGAYRFMNHHKVTPNKILSPHFESTLERIKAQAVVLIPQDTTEIDFTGRKNMSGIGYLSNESGQGFYIHPSIAFTPDRCCLGVVDFQLWIREHIGSRENRKNKPIEEKETHCWLKGYEATNKIAKAAPNTIVVSISDREGDIYDVLEKQPSDENKAYWLVRCQHNRRVLNPENGLFENKLKEALHSTDVVGHVEFDVPAGHINRNSKARHLRKARSVKQEIRIAQVMLRPPNRKDREVQPTNVYVVHCKEINVSEGETAIEWYLLTSYPTHTIDEAITIINWYLCRWQIEVFFKVLKSGCKVEELQFESLRSTTNCLALYMIVAWRVLFLTMMGRVCPDIDCNVVFDDCEWRAVYTVVKKEKPPNKPPTLYSMIIMIAKLGGFLARKSDGYPGPSVMWQGIQRMRDFTLAWEAFHHVDNSCAD